MVNFVYPEELAYFIESIRPFPVKDIGTPKWLDVHEIIIKLSQQAVVEAAEQREEEIKELLIGHDKLKILVHEAYCVQVWKTRVLPHLLEIDPNPHATFLIYTVLFHEASIIGLLDTSLYHVSGVETLGESAIDMVDYCAQAISQVIGLVSMGYLENETDVDVDEAVLSELERQKRDLIFKIGMRCISIIQYIAENSHQISISTARRMIVQHDIPWLIIDVLCFRPWQRTVKKGLQRFIDDKWINVQNEDLPKVTGTEAQSWFCLYQLIFNKDIMQSYELTEARCKQLSKAIGLLHDTLIDQLPPLMQLKQFLTHMTVGSMAASKQTDKGNLLLEEIPEICEQIMLEAEQDGGFAEIAQHQEQIFLNNDMDKIKELAKRLSEAYNTDLLLEFDDNQTNSNETNDDDDDDDEEKNGDDGDGISGSSDNVAGDNDNDDAVVEKTDENVEKTTTKIKHFCCICNAKADKKCSECLKVYYCARKCQLDDWPKHKLICKANNNF